MARLCAHETYMDTPYYEQLQYVGDTRIQALVSLYMTGDDRLVRQAIDALRRVAHRRRHHREPRALAPAQYIPPFSLWWVAMVHDYWLYRDDPAFVRARLPACARCSRSSRTATGGRVPRPAMPWWSFVDWARAWPRGVPPGRPGRCGAGRGGSAPLDLQLLLAYGYAADLEESVGSPARAAEYPRGRRRLRAAIQSMLLGRRHAASTPTPGPLDQFSQHANVLAVLAGLVSEGEPRAPSWSACWATSSLVPCSIYFRHYLHEALNRAGLGDRYLDALGPWRDMLAQGLTTWAETNDPEVRSDCHAWGASPNFELFRTVLGIDSAAPGFRRVVIRPFLGDLARASGSMPHPRGEVSVRLSRTSGGVKADVSLPDGVEGDFVWGEHAGHCRPARPRSRFPERREIAPVRRRPPEAAH